MVLKGGNRRSFEMRLEAAVRRRVAQYGGFSVGSKQSVVFVEPQSETCDVPGAFGSLRGQFGAASLNRAVECEKDVSAIAETAKTYLADDFARAKSFKVETKRADKRFPMTSVEVSQYVGGELNEAFPQCAVNMRNPELMVLVEIREDSAFVHGNAVRGAGGLPPGSAGRAVSLLSGGIDSPVSTYLAARRGLRITPVHFFSFPYTSERAKEKVIELTRILARYCGVTTLEVVPFTRIQEEIARGCPEEFGTIITRRFMAEIAEKIAFRVGASAVVTGENLGQVASQTIESLAVTGAGLSLPVLRPLITFDKREITEWAERIGTLKTSILPYEDCCTVFTPRRPSTKPRLARITEAEAALDRETLIAEAFAGTEKIKIDETGII
jgi:thiamine biosynthesis protein ThiI